MNKTLEKQPCRGISSCKDQDSRARRAERQEQPRCPGLRREREMREGRMEVRPSRRKSDCAGKEGPS